jgi:hypothetical protein
MVYHNHIA